MDFAFRLRQKGPESLLRQRGLEPIPLSRLAPTANREAANAERQYERLLALRSIPLTTKNVGKVAPRPFMIPALEKAPK